MGWQVWIDRGGTFTDVVARAPDGAVHVEKLLSEAPAYADAAVEAVRRLLGRHGGGEVEAVKMGTTVATNALLERRGEPTALVITEGHADALAIGWQSRPRLFDLHIQKPTPLNAFTVEASERVTAKGCVLRPLDEARLAADLAGAYAAGARAAAIVFMHAHRFPAHERRAAEIARAAGFTQVSASHEVAPLIKLVSRGDTTVVDAYLSPVLARYVDQVRSELAATPGAEHARLLFMQSSGGLAEAGAFRGKDAVLSGPAGGLVGLAAAAREAGFDRVIGFDMGGTSTDVSHYAGAFERTEETEVAGVRLRAPMLAVHTVAAGGGSVCRFEDGRLRVGPQSAGADPGPAAYRRGGPLTVTDCNVLLGRILPDRFPAVFGPAGDQPLDLEAVRARFAALAQEVEAATSAPRSPEQLAEGFLQVAVENMARAIKRVSTERGHDLADYALMSFGGAGGQHACRVAQALGVRTVLLHPLAGVLSAWGMGLAPLQASRSRTVAAPLDPQGWPEVEAAVAALEAEARAALVEQGAPAEAVRIVTRLSVRYAGVDSALELAFAEPTALAQAFEAEHRTRFGFATPGRPLVVEAAAVEVTAGADDAPPRRPLSRLRRQLPQEGSIEGDGVRSSPLGGGGPPEAVEGAAHATSEVWFGHAPQPTPVYDRARLAPGAAFAGPAIVQEVTGTVVVEPGWRARVAPHGALVLERVEAAAPRGRLDSAVDPLQLELFASRFMAAAEEMGAALQATAASVNIKERLDFSCAVFDAAGALVANAPHIPVHLGSMGESVKAVMAARAGDGRGVLPGDAYMHNAPYAGGTHLPDITVITPVFAEDGGGELLCWVAARGHHADVGGLTPGSMPPDSRSIADEGALFDDVLLVDGATSELREAEVRAILGAGAHPARNPDENLADLRAQLAACAKGAAALRTLYAAHGRGGVDAYMGHLQDAAADAVRRRLPALADGGFRYEMDDGAVIAVALRLDRAAGRLTIDFTGTSPQRPTNFNAPRAITRAAVLYWLRTLIAADIPLNDGCLRPVDLIVPEGCMLDPRPPGAVVAGNVETSQAITDALYGALLAAGRGVVAASQGTMNNLTFGDGARQYYETICGGAGAGPGFRGADAVQTHMTNSRLTDPEVLETRFPVRVERFAIRRGSGGAGAWRGGDGVERRLVFTAPVTASILSGHRRVPPFGAEGGAPGALGENRVERADGRVEPLQGVDRRDLAPGDALVVLSPGGGGWGRMETP